MVESLLAAFARLHLNEWVIISIFFGIYLWKIIYLFLFTGRVLFLKKPEADGYNPVSLLLAFRNEEENLKKNLAPLFASVKPDSEVVAVDDFSQDNSLSVLGVFKSNWNNLKISSLPQETRYSEKMARNIALKAARNEWAMVIPPAVSSTGKNWGEVISTSNGIEKNVVVNYSNLVHTGKFFNLLYRSECFFQQLKSFGFILNGLSFINFEENVAFRKSKYFEAGGFGQRVKEPFANLELVINTFITKNNSEINFTHNTAIKKELQVTCGHFTDLLKKEMHIRNYLPVGKRLVLFTERILTLVFLPFAITLFFLFVDLWPVFSFLLIVYFTAFSFIIKILLKHLNESKLFLSSLVYALIMPYLKFVYQGFLFLHRGNQKWKSKK
jgi:glycosyltransferase involved in cell wall biosynthesis